MSEMYSPTELAYLGDSVFETAIRKALLKKGRFTLKEYNKMAMKTVCATSQAKGAEVIAPMLTEAEADIMRRGRNAHCGNVPKSATAVEYRVATGVETLFGWLYLNGEFSRIDELAVEFLKLNEI